MSFKDIIFCINLRLNGTGHFAKSLLLSFFEKIGMYYIVRDFQYYLCVNILEAQVK